MSVMIKVNGKKPNWLRAHHMVTRLKAFGCDPTRVVNHAYRWRWWSSIEAIELRSDQFAALLPTLPPETEFIVTPTPILGLSLQAGDIVRCTYSDGSPVIRDKLYTVADIDSNGDPSLTVDCNQGIGWPCNLARFELVCRPEVATGAEAEPEAEMQPAGSERDDSYPGLVRIGALENNQTKARKRVDDIQTALQQTTASFQQQIDVLTQKVNYMTANRDTLALRVRAVEMQIEGVADKADKGAEGLAERVTEADNVIRHLRNRVTQAEKDVAQLEVVRAVESIYGKPSPGIEGSPSRVTYRGKTQSPFAADIPTPSFHPDSSIGMTYVPQPADAPAPIDLFKGIEIIVRDTRDLADRPRLAQNNLENIGRLIENILPTAMLEKHFCQRPFKVTVL